MLSKVKSFLTNPFAVVKPDDVIKIVGAVKSSDKVSEKITVKYSIKRGGGGTSTKSNTIQWSDNANRFVWSVGHVYVNGGVVYETVKEWPLNKTNLSQLREYLVENGTFDDFKQLEVFPEEEF